MAKKLTVFEYCSGAEEAAVDYAIEQGIPCFSDIKELHTNTGKITLKKSLYSGELIGCFETNSPCVATLSKDYDGVFPLEGADTVTVASQHSNEFPLKDTSSYYDSSGDNLSRAKLVIVAGRGIGSKNAFDRICAIAEKMGADVGATRSVVMYGWAPLAVQVGVSGVSLNAEVCLTLGASGAEAFAAGLDKCKTIISVNNDKSAPIFSRADIGIVADCKEIISELEARLKK